MLTQITLNQIDTFFNADVVVDELGAIDQQIKALESTARKLKAELIAKGVGKYSGAKFCAEVQHYDRATINPILVRKLADDEFVRNVTQIKPIDAVVVKLIDA
jgi:PHP family Zn ribbon phosphoesterase